MATIQVGPSRALTTITAGYTAASAGDTIEIDAGPTAYTEFVRVQKDNLTFRGVTAVVGGITYYRPIHNAASVPSGFAAGQNACFILGANNLTVINMELTGRGVSEANGVRLLSPGASDTFRGGLTLQRCYLHHCDNGILGAAGTDNDITVQDCEFAYNSTAGTGQSHAMYVHSSGTLLVEGCYFHRNRVFNDVPGQQPSSGHYLKSRCPRNIVRYNFIADQDNGTASQQLDFPTGGWVWAYGNVFQKGIYCDSSSFSKYGVETQNGVIGPFTSSAITRGATDRDRIIGAGAGGQSTGENIVTSIVWVRDVAADAGTAYTAGVDYELSATDNDVVWLPGASRTPTLSASYFVRYATATNPSHAQIRRGSTSTDAIPGVPSGQTITSLADVRDGKTIFVETTDYSLSGNSIVWVSGRGPSLNTIYRVRYNTDVHSGDMGTLAYVNNTWVNDLNWAPNTDNRGHFTRVYGQNGLVSAQTFRNNWIVGNVIVLIDLNNGSTSVSTGTVQDANPGAFVARSSWDYHPTSSASTIIDQGVSVGVVNGHDCTPVKHFVPRAADAGATRPNADLTASVAAGSGTLTTSADVFEAEDVGKVVTILAGTNKNKQARITGFTSASQVSAYMYDRPSWNIAAATPLGSWELSSIEAQQDFPTTTLRPTAGTLDVGAFEFNATGEQIVLGIRTS